MIRITGSFLDRLIRDFTDGLDCIIGARHGHDECAGIVHYSLDALPDSDDSERQRMESPVKATVGGADARAINEAHAHKALRDRERRAMEATDQFLREYREQLNNLDGALSGQMNSLFAREILTGPNSALLQAVRLALIDRGYEIDHLLEQAPERIKAQQFALADASEALVLAHARQEMAFRAIIERHQAAQGQAAERAKLERLRNDLLAKKRQREETARKLADFQQARQKLLGTLSELRDERFGIRRQVTARINQALSPESRASVTQCGCDWCEHKLLEEAFRAGKLRFGLLVQMLVGQVVGSGGRREA